MQMIGKNHNGIDDERTLAASRAQGVAKKINTVYKDFGISIRERNGEEERPTGNEVAPVTNHIEFVTPIAPRMSLRSCGLQWLQLVARMSGAISGTTLSD